MLKHILYCVIGTACLACSSEKAPPDTRPTLGDRQGVIGSRTTYRVTNPQASGAQLAERVRKLAEVVTGKALTDSPFLDSLARSGALEANAEYWIDKVSDAAPNLNVNYEFKADALSVDDANLEMGIPRAGEEQVISEAEARSIFVETVRRLDEAGLITASEYDLDAVEVGYTDYGSAPSGEEAVPHILNYRFSAYRVLDGLVFRDSHLLIAVHQSKRIAAVKLRRAGVEVVAEGSSAANLSMAACEKRFDSEYPGSHVYFRQLAYVLPDPKAPGLAEAKCVVSFTALTPLSDGTTVAARRQQARYELGDASARPVVLPPADTVPGDARPKTQ